MAFSAIRSSMAAKRSLYLYSLFRSPSIAGNRRWLSESNNPSPSTNDPTTSTSSSLVPVSYILASHKLEVGHTVMNSDSSQSSERSFLHSSDTTSTYQRFKDLLRMANIDQTEGETEQSDSSQKARAYDIVDLHSQVGNCLPLSDIPIGTFVHSIECRPGQGAKLVRAAGTCAKILKEPAELCLIRLPSGVEKLIDSRCRATIGSVSNPTHKARKLRKAGQSRWLGRRPVVRGVAMNPIDHPHGGGEGRASGGRPSVTPWGKPTKAGYKTVLRKSTKVRFT